MPTDLMINNKSFVIFYLISYIISNPMPPKKQEQLQSVQYKPCFILPIFINGHQSAGASAFSKPVNIKKNIDTPKIIQILKDKGLQQFIVQGKLNDKGRLFACENIKIVCDQFIAGLSKPADTKKDVKKDAKKQAKKQQPPAQNIIAPIEIQFQKNCSDFFVFLSVPATPQQLRILLSKDIKIDIVTVIKQKIKPGSRKPNYQLLNNKRSHEDLSQTLKSTVTNTKTDGKINENDKGSHLNHKLFAKQMIEQINEYRSKISYQNTNKNIVVLQIPFINDLSNPEANENNFIRSFFQRVCRSTKQFDQFMQWKSGRKLVPMIEPIKQKAMKQVQVQDKNDKGKKGGKPAQPIYQTVEEIIQKKYEDFPENIKSDLKSYYLVKNVSSKRQNKVNLRDNESIYKRILLNCLNALETQEKNNLIKAQTSSIQKSQVERIGGMIKNRFELQPINKVTNLSIANKLRSINYPKNMSMCNSLYFEYPNMASQFSFMQLSQKSDKDKQQLKMEFIINKLQDLAKTSSPKIGWSFRDRRYLQKFTKQQLESLISEQLLHDPEVFTGYLGTQGLKLIVMSRTNPPGRVLYHNSIMEWKVLPNYQNWTDYFLKSEELLAKQQFYDYPFEQAGNLAVKTKNMMPADNTVIRDQMYAIGQTRDNIVQLYKDSNKFGLTKKKLHNGQQIYTYWHDFEDQYRLRILKTKIHIYGNISTGEHHGNKNQEEIKIQDIEKVESSLGVLLQSKNNYIVMMDPNPIIYWSNHQQQKIRQFGSLGEITSYKKDGSIHIYSPNGDISILKHGKWSRIIQNQLKQNGQIRKLQLTQLNQGENIIKIREDQTIFILDPFGNKKTIFPDGTEIHEELKQKKRQIKNPVGPFIRIFLPRDYNLNTIGHGSAFAYLGFKNILQRSYDGYLFEFIDHQISSHFYTERYELNGKIQTQYIRLIVYKDSSILKINSRSANLVHVSPSKNQLMNEQTLNQRWLQAFTTPTNHGQGVFDIDLNKGHIENKDSETNRFVAKVDQRSESHIAVSFVMEDEDDSFSNFPNGFHIKQQNYFLPPPTNRIPPRIFTINQDGSGIQYLNKDQINSMKQYTIINEHQGNKNISQYSMQMSPLKSYMALTFSQPVKLDIFGLPDILKTSETKQSMIPVHFFDIKHRIIQQIAWNSDYTGLKTLEEKLKEQTSQKFNRKSARKQVKKTEERLFEN